MNNGQQTLNSNELKKQEKLNNLETWRTSKELLATDWFDLTTAERNIHVRAGDIYRCELGENIGYEINKTRPVLVISDTRYNQAGQVIVIPITSTNRPQRVHYILKKEKYNFLSNDSCVKTEQIKSVSTSRLTQFKGRINEDDLARVKTRLKTIFNL